MARWSASDWGRSERTIGGRQLIAAMVIVLVVGVMIGYVARGSTAPKTKLASKDFRNSVVIDPSTDAIQAADQSEGGAVRAVTSFITGLPNVALKSPQEEAGVLDTVMDPQADPSVRADLQNTIDSGRNQLVGTGSFQKTLTTKLLFSPASYKVEMLAKDRARVQVWMVLVTVDGSQQQAVANWSTSDVVVRWTDHWRVSSFASDVGPTPTVQNATGISDSYANVVNRINGFQGYRYATGTGTN